MHVYLEIQMIGAKITLPSKLNEHYFGKEEIKKAARQSLADPTAYDSITRIHKDPNGKITKYHFVIVNQRGTYTIEDQYSTNGTYLDAVNIKGKGPQALKDGDPIVVAIQQNGKLISLTMYFHIKNEPEPAIEETSPESSGEYVDPSAGRNASSPASIPTPSYASSSSNVNSSSSGAVYNTPISRGSKPNPSTPKGVKSVPIAQTAPPTSADDEGDTNDASVAHYLDPNLSHSQIQNSPQDQVDTSGSFILVQQAVTIPPNAFRPDSGVDLSMVYRLEKSEKWHIMGALGLLFLMVFHSYLNLMLVMYLIGGFQNPNPAQSLWQTLLLDPTVLGLIFAITFVIHEMAHLNMGKHFKFQSRFCLTKVGVKSTKKAAIIGFPLGLPGAAVSIGVDATTDKDKMGWIKMAGPTSNLIFGTILLLVGYLLPASIPMLRTYLIQGASLNYVLGAFNLIPISVKGFALDGENIIKWNKGIYIMLMAFAVIGVLISMTVTMMI